VPDRQQRLRDDRQQVVETGRALGAGHGVLPRQEHPMTVWLIGRLTAR
jgi:hypothetical protein